MANSIPSRTFSDLLPMLDRNRNKLLDPSEASVAGRVGNDNGFNGFAETTEALESGRAALKDFRLSAADADAVAERLAGGDTWVSKEDVFISDAARSRIDGFGGSADGRVSKAELSGAFQRKGFAIHRDGIFLSSEIEDRLRSGRPTPPPTGRPTPPPTDRPTPPPVSRPTPPSVDRPTPPSIGLAPHEVSDRYQQQRRTLTDLYNRSSGVMSYSEFQRRDKDLIQGAVTDLVRGTRDAAYSERRTALTDIYNRSSGNMSYAEFQAADKELIRSEVDDIRFASGSYQERRAALTEVYNRSSGNMSYAEFQAADKGLIKAAVEDLLMTPGDYRTQRRDLTDLYNRSSGNMSYAEFQSTDKELIRYAVEDLMRSRGSFDDKKRRLTEIYNLSSGNMSYSEYQAAERRILDQSLGRL